MALVCKIELSQTAGITLTVVNKDGNITQTACMDGTAITLTCKGQQATSTITQDCDSVTVKCNNFTVEAENITCKSSKDTQHQAQGTFTIDSTGKATVKTSDEMDVSATSKYSLSAADIAASAQNTAKLTALTTTVNGDQKASVTGMELSLSAQTNAALDGLAVKVSAQTTMDVEGLTTTVKGQMTNVQGTLVKLG